MLKGLAVVLGLAFACTGFATTASAMPKWEKSLLQRYVTTKPCTGQGAPSWGKASMERWRAAQRSAHRYDAY
jgi:hypothetical protein